MAANARLFDPESDPEVDRLLNDSPQQPKGSIVIRNVKGMVEEDGRSVISPTVTFLYCLAYLQLINKQHK